jgi:hypothetical protein
MATKKKAKVSDQKCWYCGVRPREASPPCLYCEECRLRMAAGEIKSVLFNPGLMKFIK